MAFDKFDLADLANNQRFAINGKYRFKILECKPYGANEDPEVDMYYSAELNARSIPLGVVIDSFENGCQTQAFGCGENIGVHPESNVEWQFSGE